MTSNMYRSTSLFSAPSRDIKLCVFKLRDAESEIEGGRPGIHRNPGTELE